MGLDNGFILRHTESKVECEIAYFRKYYELDTWIKQNAKSVDEDYEYYIDKNVLESLMNYIKPIYNILILVESGLIRKYDNEGYSKSLIKKLEAVAYDNPFSPISSQSSFAGWKLIHLYQSIYQLIEIIDLDTKHNWSIYFYSSY